MQLPNPLVQKYIIRHNSDHTNESIHREFQNDLVISPYLLSFQAWKRTERDEEQDSQQIDIMPTILSYLNYDEEFIAFGNNLFDDSQESFAFNTNGSNYHLYMYDHMLGMVDNKPVGLYNYKNDRFLENNLLDSNKELARCMEEKTKGNYSVI